MTDVTAAPALADIEPKRREWGHAETHECIAKCGKMVRWQYERCFECLTNLREQRRIGKT